MAMEMFFTFLVLTLTLCLSGRSVAERCKDVDSAMYRHLGECMCTTASTGAVTDVNCTDLDMTTAIDLGTDLPTTLESLTFVGNRLTSLGDNLFGTSKHYNNFNFLNLSHNNIINITGKAFHKVASVQELDLSFNDWFPHTEFRVFSNFVSLKNLHLKSAFKEYNGTLRHVQNLRKIFNASSLGKLEYLDLSYNWLYFIPSDFTQQLPSLKILHMEYNDMLDMNLQHNCTKNLEELYIQGNSITGFDKYAVQDLVLMPKLKKLVLHDNPWECDCQLEATIDFLKSNASRRFIDEDQRKKLTCTNPPSLKGRQIGLLETHELAPCKHYGGMSSSLRTSYIIIGIIFGIVAVLFVVIMYLNRAKMKGCFIQYSEPIRSMIFGHGSSRGYSTVNI